MSRNKEAKSQIFSFEDVPRKYLLAPVADLYQAELLRVI